MEPFATVEDMRDLWREMSEEEERRAEKLLPIISDSLRIEAQKAGKDLDQMVEESPALKNVALSVTVDVAARALMTSTNEEPMSQMSQSALGYSISGTYLVPGGGLFIKKSELARIGLRRQKYGVIEFYGDDKGDHSNTDQQD